MFTPRFKGCFDNHSISAGQVYFLRRAVELVRKSGQAYHLTVKGSERSPYDVFLDFQTLRKGDDLETYCSCPRYQGGGLCKHVWASLLEIESQKLESVKGSKRLNIAWNSECIEFDLDEVDEDETQADSLVAPVSQLVDTESMDVLDRVKAALQRQLQMTTPVGETHGSNALIVSPTQVSQSLSAPLTAAQLPVPLWKGPLQALQLGLSLSTAERRPSTSTGQVWYAINVQRSMEQSELCFDLFNREMLPDGQLSKPRLASSRADIESRAESRIEREFLEYCWREDVDEYQMWYHFSRSTRRVPDHQISIDCEDAEVFLPRLAMTQRVVWLSDSRQSWGQVRPIAWDGVPYRFVLSAERNDDTGAWVVSGQLARMDGSQVSTLSDVVMSTLNLVLFPDRLGMLDVEADSQWIAQLKSGPWLVTDDQRVDFLEYLSNTSIPATHFPAEFCKAETIAPVPILSVELATTSKKQEVIARLAYKYGDARVPITHQSGMAFDRLNGVMYERNTPQENAFVKQANQLHFSPGVYWSGSSPLKIPMANFPELSRTATSHGWIVEADRAKLRTGGQIKLSVTSSATSNIDWFDLNGKVEFDGSFASLPKLLDAVRQERQTIQLDDGSVGLLPEEWIKRFGRMADLASMNDGQLRFQSSQALLLDALLASDQSAQVDQGFQDVRKRLQKTHEVKQLSEPRGFGGELRDYQKHGQGWLSCLHELQLGGCLADDMGLGKTVQVLSWLETLRQRAARRKNTEHRPSLVVVPKSLVFNWVAEATKFAPKLRVLNFTGKERVGLEDLKEIDLVVTTYGTMRLDIEKLRKIEFEYLILDEAQAIKNSISQVAKAARLLKGRHRLAMSGTPIENHLGELWSLFEFINPGLLGNSTAFQRVARGAAQDPESLQWLSKAIAPFVLRRTKGQVLTELPEKSEQIIYCEMSTKHRKLYDELRDHYRASLANTVRERGLEQSKIIVLEALLRLRQAACHPGLLNVSLTKELGAKLEELLDRLKEIMQEGHKALVFSQFTSFLGILQKHLRKEKLPFLYLDGQTSLKERQARVEKFQSSDSPSLFLISLKAGGSGLNLTAADYVFLLDPWWNPAVENQAIDRTHRIGQTQKVHACRMITKGTVEEKVLELQQQKKNLAEAVLSMDGGMLRKLSWEDIQVLFS